MSLRSNEEIHELARAFPRFRSPAGGESAASRCAMKAVDTGQRRRIDGDSRRIKSDGKLCGTSRRFALSPSLSLSYRRSRARARTHFSGVNSTADRLGSGSGPRNPTARGRTLVSLRPIAVPLLFTFPFLLSCSFPPGKRFSTG